MYGRLLSFGKVSLDWCRRRCWQWIDRWGITNDNIDSFGGEVTWLHDQTK